MVAQKREELEAAVAKLEVAAGGMPEGAPGGGLVVEGEAGQRGRAGGRRRSGRRVPPRGAE
eukprot:3620231-Lingulodinium_polyedra.AAC.1